MFLAPVLTSAFICYTILLNSVLASELFKPEFFGLTADERNRILGIVGGIRDNPLGIFGFNKLPENEDKPAPPKPKPKVAGIKVAARSAVAVDCETGDVIFEQSAREKWPIASITKLMTALVFLDYNPGWETVYEIKREDRRDGGRIYLYYGEKAKVKDIFYTSLVASDNTATIALISSAGLSEEKFVAKMNEQAVFLGMANTKFIDATGLKSNESTAEEIAKFAAIALANEDIRRATLTEEYRFKTLEGKEKIIPSTDQLLREKMDGGMEIAGGKTGFTEEAGYCFAGRFKKDGHELVTVVLGAPTAPARFTETGSLVKWVFENFKWEDGVVGSEGK
ncbi:MAG: serine hydrolase [Patescibacteria group bacterium]|jgi:D-alanyl-D-alanine carboxypeptidase